LSKQEQIPSLRELVSPGVMELIAQRPRAAAHMATGRFGDLIAGWRAQAALLRGRLAQEVLAARVDLCPDEDIRELAEGELWQRLPDTPQRAVGECVVTRSVTNALSSSTGHFAIGVFPLGFRLRKDVRETELSPNQQGATYRTTAPVYADPIDTVTADNGDGTYTHTQTITLPAESDIEGPEGNVALVPADEENGLGAFVDTPFDTSFEVVSLRAAGGATGRTATQLRALARVAHLGQLGPNDAAIVAGALTDPGVHYVAYRSDPTNAVGALYVADESWGYSEAFLNRVQRTLIDGDWLAWGARVDVRGIATRAVMAQMDCVLLDPLDLLASTDIAAAIRQRLLNQFTRRYWYTWSTTGLRGLIAAADRRILQVSNVQVLHQGVVESDPTSQLDTTQDQVTRWYLVDNGVRVNFSA
jgi:hypothetical protein